MAKILIQSKGHVEVCEDDYERGRGAYVNSFDFDIRGKYDSIEEIISALNKRLYWDLTINDIYYLDGYLHGSAQVDVYNDLVDMNDFEMFKNGEVDWYIADFFVPLEVGDIHSMSEEEAEEFGIPLY